MRLSHSRPGDINEFGDAHKCCASHQYSSRWYLAPRKLMRGAMIARQRTRGTLVAPGTPARFRALSDPNQFARRTAMGSRLIAAAAVSVLALSTAWAQTPSPPSDTAKATPSDGVGSVTSQSSDQWLASKLIGTNVYNEQNEKIGSISDLLLDKKAQPVAIVVGVGGFLGIGEKKVAVDMKSLEFMRSATDGDKVTAKMTKDQLLAAADFKPYTPPAPERPATATRPPMGAPPSGSPGAVR